MALIEVKVPDIGDFKDVAVIELLVKLGDSVKLEQSLVTVESDKASMEIPASAAGVVKEMKVKIGDTVNEGSLLLMLETEGVAETTPAPAPAAPAPAAAPAAAVALTKFLRCIFMVCSSGWRVVAGLARCVVSPRGAQPGWPVPGTPS